MISRRCIVAAVFFCAVVSSGLALMTLACSTHAKADTNLPDRVTRFDGFPVVWLGEAYDADGNGVPELSLSSVKQIDRPAGVSARGQVLHPAVKSLNMTYGTCKIAAGDDGCYDPVQIVVYSPCDAPVLDEGIVDHDIKLREATARVYGGGNLWVETADFTVQIFSFLHTGNALLSEQDTVAVANALRGANGLAASLTEASPFQDVALRDCP